MKIQTHDAAGEGLRITNLWLLPNNGPELTLLSTENLGRGRTLETYDFPADPFVTTATVLIDASRFDPVIEALTFFHGAAPLIGLSGMTLTARDLGRSMSSLLSGSDTVLGAGNNDLLRGFGGDDLLSGKGGSDRLLGEGGHDRLVGGGGNDDLLGHSGNDRLSGGRGEDVLYGGTGSDRLVGGGGADTLSGGGGTDSLLGGGGDDRLDGAAGRDHLVGGRGADTFVLTGAGRDSIADFRAGEDIALIRGGFEFDDLRFEQTGEDVTLRFGRKSAIFLDSDLADVDQSGNFDFF